MEDTPPTWALQTGMSNDWIGITLTLISMIGLCIFLYAMIWRNRESNYDEPDWWRKTWNSIEPDPAPKAPAGIEKK
jgi:hypothetical protein